MEWASVASVLRPWPLENKRFYLVPDARGSGVAATLLQARVEYARGSGVQHPLRLETGDQQHAAIRFYRKHGFTDIPASARTSTAPPPSACSGCWPRPDSPGTRQVTSSRWSGASTLIGVVRCGRCPAGHADRVRLTPLRGRLRRSHTDRVTPGPAAGRPSPLLREGAQARTGRTRHRCCSRATAVRADPGHRGEHLSQRMVGEQGVELAGDGHPLVQHRQQLRGDAH
jgi:hypothetical protein